MLTLVALAIGCSDYGFATGLDGHGPRAGEDDEERQPRPGETPEEDTRIDIPGNDEADELCEGADLPEARDVALASECDGRPAPGSFRPVVEWSAGIAKYCGPPAVGQTIDTNGSGDLDALDMPLIFMLQNGFLEAWWGDGSGRAWQTTGRESYGNEGGLAVGDLDKDGWPDIVSATSSTVVAVDGRTGADKWRTYGLAASSDPLNYTMPSITDMDADGLVEVTLGNAILDGQTGAVIATGAYGKGAMPFDGDPSGQHAGVVSVPVDVDDDGEIELVTGNAAYRRDGSAVWANGHLDGFPAVADFDLDGQGEIIKTSGIYAVMMETDGSPQWSRTFSGNLSPPAVDDLDGDGRPDIVFAAQSELIALDGTGEVLWRSAITDVTGAAGPSLYDFDGDGYPEVLYADEQAIRFFSGLDGSVRFESTDHRSQTILETPVVADVDLDGEVEIVLGHCDKDLVYSGVTVFGDAEHSWPAGRSIWNQHAYFVDNVSDRGLVTADGNNWPELNSFRSGDEGAAPGEVRDLQVEILDVCAECEATVQVVARVLNAGDEHVSAGVSVALRAGPGGPVVATLETTEAIPSGRSGEALWFEVDAAALEGTAPVVEVDRDPHGADTIAECHEDNNDDAWGEVVCP